MADKDSSSTASGWSAVAEQMAKLRAGSGTGSTIGASESGSTIGAPSESGTARSSATGSTISVPGSGKQWLVTNYLDVTCRASGIIRTYRVDLNPEEDDTRIKKLILKPHEDTLGRFVMDGHTLFIGKKIEEQHLNLETKLASGKDYQVTLRLSGELAPSNVSTNQFFHVAFRSVLQAMQFEAIGRSHFQREKKIALHEHKLELWSGVMTAISDRQGGKMLCIEATHKVLRLETALDLIQTLARRSVEDVREGLKHAIVMTHYNRKTYGVDAVCFDFSPRIVFKKDEAGNEVTYLDYCEQKYGIKIPEKEKDQPMLKTIPRRKDVSKLADASLIYLVPRLCYMTGLTDSQRKNFKLMKELSECLHLSPQQRKDKMSDFIKTLQFDNKVMEILSKWNISIGTQFKKVPSSVLNPSMVNMKLTYGEINEYKPVNTGNPMEKTGNASTSAIRQPMSEQMRNLRAGVGTRSKEPVQRKDLPITDVDLANIPHILWGGKHVTNTCPFDNFLQLLVVAYTTRPAVKSFFDGAVEGIHPKTLIIKSIIQKLLSEDFDGAKTAWLEQVLNKRVPRRGKLDCAGFEHDFFVKPWNDIYGDEVYYDCNDHPGAYGQTDSNDHFKIYDFPKLLSSICGSLNHPICTVRGCTTGLRFAHEAIGKTPLLIFSLGGLYKKKVTRQDFPDSFSKDGIEYELMGYTTIHPYNADYRHYMGAFKVGEQWFRYNGLRHHFERLITRGHASTVFYVQK